MSLYDVKVESLSELPPLAGAVVVSDCDETLFEHGTTNLFPEVEEALRHVATLALVSANPDKELMIARQDVLGAEIRIAADKARWYKGRLFRDAAQQLDGVTDELVIMGDRSVADVGIAKAIFSSHGFNTLGVRVARPNLPVSVKADYVLRPGFVACAAAIKLAGQDERLRPRQEEGMHITQAFLSQRAV